MTKRLLSLVLVLSILLFALPVFAQAEQEMIEVDVLLAENSGQPCLLDTPVLRYIREHFQIDFKLQPIPASDWETKLSTLFATNDLPDVIANASFNFLNQYAGEGMLVNTLDYADKLPNYMSLMYAEDRELETKKFLINDALYGFRRLESYRIPLAPMGGIRRDLLQEVGRELPKSFDELYDTLLAIKEKHPEMTFFSSRNGTNYMLGQMAFAFGTGGFPTFSTKRGMYYEPDYDRYVYGPTDERFVQLVEYLAKAYKDGLVDPDYATNDRTALWQKITSGQVGYFCDNNSFLARVFNPAFADAGTDWFMELIPPMTNNITEQRLLRYERDWDGFTVINKDCPHIDRLLEYFDWCYTEEGIMVTNFGIEGETYTIDEKGNPVIVDSIMEQTKGAPDQYAAVQSILGVGTWSWTQYIDERTHLQTSPGYYLEMGETIVQPNTDSGVIRFLPNWPAFTEDELEQIVELELAITNVFDQEIDKFIMGTRPISEWPSFQDSLAAAGTGKLEEIFNAAYERLK